MIKKIRDGIKKLITRNYLKIHLLDSRSTVDLKLYRAPITDEFAEDALNFAATNIVLLVGIYKRGK